MTVTPADLGTYLSATVDDDRGQLLLDLAQQLCESIVKPLPNGADAVVLDVAARAYSNPTNAVQQGAGPFSANFGPVGGGMWLTRQNKATLRRLAGSGGAFSIDTMPAAAGTDLPPWEINRWGGYGNYGDWDVTP
jgi:hypothetical protein